MPHPGEKERAALDTAIDVFLIVFGGIVAVGAAYATWQRWGGASLDEKLTMIEELVQAAEQMMGERGKRLPGTERAEWVIEQFRIRFPEVDLADVQIWLEAAVHRMNERRDNAIVETAPVDDRGGAYWLGKQN